MPQALEITSKFKAFLIIYQRAPPLGRSTSHPASPLSIRAPLEPHRCHNGARPGRTTSALSRT